LEPVRFGLGTILLSAPPMESWGSFHRKSCTVIT